MSWAAAIKAGASLLGGQLDRNAQSEGKTARLMNWKQFQYQKELNRKQIQWRVEDAKAAGLHPLYALGHSASFSPVNFIPGQSTTGGTMGDAFARAGDAIGEAIPTKAQAKAGRVDDVLQQSQVRAVNASAMRDEAAAAVSAFELQQKVDRANITQDQPINTQSAPNLFIDVWDNHANKMIRVPNPQLGFEMPETLGAYMYGRGRLEEPVKRKLPQSPIRNLSGRNYGD